MSVTRLDGEGQKHVLLLELLREDSRRMEGKDLPNPISLSEMARKSRLTNQSLFKKFNRMREEGTIEKRKVGKYAYYYMKRWKVKEY